ncbi:MAG: MFS transporter [Trueperaceae bacterium]|nr:MFS transporter [Trueperaceae bacterium]
MRAALLRRRHALVLGGGRLVAFAALAHVVNDAFVYGLPVFLPGIQLRFGWGEATLASLVTLVAIASNVAQGVSGTLVDRWGRRRSAAVGVLTVAVMISLVPSIEHPFLLVAVLVAGGFGSALFHPAAAALVRSTGGGATALGIYGAGGPIGVALFPVAALALLEVAGPEGVLVLAWGGVLAALGFLAFVPHQPPAPRPPRGVRGTRGWGRPPSIDTTLLRGRSGALLTIGTLQATADLTFLSSLPLLMTGRWGLETTSPWLAAGLAAYQLAAAAGSMGIGLIDARWPRRWVVAGSFVAAGPFLTATLILPPTTAAFLVAAAFAGAFTSSVIPLLIAQAQDEAPDRLGAATGMQVGVTWGLAGIAYLGVGVLQQAFGVTAAMAVAYAALVPALLLALRAVRHVPTPADAEPVAPLPALEAPA